MTQWSPVKGANLLVLTVGGASVFLALPFFFQNVVRLTSGVTQRALDRNLSDKEFQAKYKYDERMNEQLRLKNRKSLGKR